MKRGFDMINSNSLTFGIGQMTCASCVGRVEKALSAVPGVQSAHVNLATETGHVEVDSGFDADLIVGALEAAGYPAMIQTYRSVSYTHLTLPTICSV